MRSQTKKANDRMNKNYELSDGWDNSTFAKRQARRCDRHISKAKMYQLKMKEVCLDPIGGFVSEDLTIKCFLEMVEKGVQE